MIWWGLLGSFIIFALAGYAALLLRQLQQQKRQQQQRAAAEAAEREIKAQQECAESIRVIASAMCSMQCEIAEGTLRLGHLLQRMDGYQDWRERYPALHEMFEKIKHQPIGIARKTLQRQEIMRFDLERMKLESAYQDAILAETKHIKAAFVKLTGNDDEPLIAA